MSGGGGGGFGGRTPSGDTDADAGPWSPLPWEPDDPRALAPPAAPARPLPPLQPAPAPVPARAVLPHITAAPAGIEVLDTFPLPSVAAPSAPAPASAAPASAAPASAAPAPPSGPARRADLAVSPPPAPPAPASSDISERETASLPAPQPAPAPPAARRRARRWRVVASCLALVVLLLMNVKVAANHSYYDMLSAPTDGLFRIHICETLGRVPDVLFMGSSRTQHGIDAPLMDRLLTQQLGRSVLTCNSGDDGSTFEHDYFMLKRYIGDGFIPRLIVENLWEYNLTSHADTYPIPTADMPWVASLNDGWDVTPHQNVLSGVANYGGFLIQKLLPLYGDRIGLLKRLCGAAQPAAQIGPCAADLGGMSLQAVNANGYAFDQGYQPTTDRTLVQLWPLIQQKSPPCSPNCYPFEISSGQTAWLEKMIMLAHQHGIRVVLNITPLSEKHFLYFAPGDWTHIHAYFQGIADISGAYFTDDSHLPGYTDLDFWDTHHLTKAGATKYTTWLASNIVAPVLIGKLSVPRY